MTTSFDTPRVLGHHNPFASFQDTTDDPLASGGGSFAQGAHTGGNSGSTSTDPWSSYYNPPIISTSSTASSSKNALLSSGVLDEDDVPDIYVQAWNAAATSSSSSSFGSAFNTGNTVSLAVVQKVLSTCAGLGAGETEKVRFVSTACAMQCTCHVKLTLILDQPMLLNATSFSYTMLCQNGPQINRSSISSQPHPVI